MNEIAQPVPAGPVGGQLAVGTLQGELTQALRRLRRAIWSERALQSMKAGKPVSSNPLVAELEKQLSQLENVRVSYGLVDEEIEE